MRTGGRLALGFAMFVLAAAAPLACGPEFELLPETGGEGGSGGGGTPSGSTNSTGSMPDECADVSNCPGANFGCVQRSCQDKVCVTTVVPVSEKSFSQIYGDCKVTTCNDMGQPSDANDDTDAYDDGNSCTTDACNNGVPKNTIVMLGLACNNGVPGKCDATGACVDCVDNSVCLGTQFCSSAGKCIPNECKNGVQNGDESAKDCGGTKCTPCVDGLACNGPKDCASAVCDSTKKTCTAPACNDNVKNGTETDTDCGGSMCAPCVTNYICKLATDCKSRVCMKGSCQEPLCTDGVLNGNESGIDCGGPTCGSCG
jgi:hypothetical protein